MSPYNTFLLALVACSAVANAAKILIVVPMASRSHCNLGNGLVFNLLADGHEITYITSFPIKDPHPKLRQIDTSSILDEMPHDFTIKKFMDGEMSLDSAIQMSVMFHFMHKGSLEHKNVQKLINDPNEKFDLVMSEYMFNTMYSGLAQIYNCPLIWFASVEPHSLSLRLIDDYANPAYTPEIMFSNLPPLSFWQRTQQLFYLLKQNVIDFFTYHILDHRVYQSNFSPIAAKKGIELAPLSVAEKSAALMLGNSHVSLGQATRLPQNYIPIGGYHISNDTKPLPKDLQQLMDNSKEGVIYFSMGSNLNSKDLPEEVKSGLVKMFGEMKYTVLWKFEEELPNLPKNLHILKWVPQPSILAHPNCKLFITHGGLLSTTETVHYGVPIIGIPTFADQFTNVQRAAKKGFAIEVPLSYGLAKDLKGAIIKAMKTTSYAEKVKELSAIYHDRPMPPAKTMVYWVNYVLRTKGAPHLRSPAFLATWYQKLYLDLLAVVLVSVYLILKVLKFIFTKKNKNKKTKTN